ncbi:precorrin-2 dehydrogenase/sirohydrochlorin ferrochelatase family protein [Pediococcus claussenii]|nr:bifunctional precorrin-2 dehydrogenase/sirohydrochlorin ferrochelatase [Pediococcus claussenii]
MLNLKNKKVVIVGGGMVAARKLRGLQSENAQITIISPQVDFEINPNKVRWIKADYLPELTKDADIVFACTNDKAVNQMIYQDAAQHQWINNVSNKESSDLYNVSVVQDEAVTYAISTNGTNPALAKKTRIRLQEFLKIKRKEE